MLKRGDSPGIALTAFFKADLELPVPVPDGRACIGRRVAIKAINFIEKCMAEAER